MTTSTNPEPTTTLTPIAGLHHVTAITADVQKNVDFYTQTLGLRLVKATVNYDDPSSYHLYYGDTLGRPGTLITFFVWPGAPRGTPGTGQVTETAYAIPRGAAAWWQTHLAAQNVTAQTATRHGETALTFQDPDGLPLALIESASAPDLHAFAQGPIPAEQAIRGLHSVTLTEASEKLPASVLVDRFRYQNTTSENGRHRFQVENAGPSNGQNAAPIVDVLLAPAARPRVGAGQVHHVAFRTPTDVQQATWLDTLRAGGHNVSPVMDRDYFHSIYFREPGGTLFEIATDTPGFTTNETPETLGTHISLPPWLEDQRAQIEASLPPLRLPQPLALEPATA